MAQARRRGGNRIICIIEGCESQAVTQPNDEEPLCKHHLDDWKKWRKKLKKKGLI